MRQSLLDSQEPVWVIGDNLDAADFFRALPELLQPDDVMALEDGAHPPVLRSWLKRHGELRKERLPLGSIWPKPTVVAVVASETNLRALAAFADGLANPEVAEHMAVFRNQQPILEWYDIIDAPVHLSPDLPEETVRAFARRLGGEACQVERISDPERKQTEGTRTWSSNLGIVLTLLAVWFTWTAFSMGMMGPADIPENRDAVFAGMGRHLIWCAVASVAVVPALACLVDGIRKRRRRAWVGFSLWCPVVLLLVGMWWEGWRW